MDEVKKILYLSYDGLTDPLGQSQVLPYIIGLEKLGYRFTIISFEKKQRLQKEKNIVLDAIKNRQINWVPLSFTSRPPVISKIWDRYKMRRTASLLHRRDNFDFLHCRSYVAGEVGLALKRKTDVPFLFDMRGFWADEKVENGQWNLKNLFYRRVYQKYKRKEKEMLLGADAIVTLTRASQAHLLAQSIYKHLHIDVIPCCADFELFDFRSIKNEDQQQLRRQLQISDGTKVITYLGSVGGWYLTKEMFRFFRQLQQTKNGDYMLLVLSKDDPEKIRKEAEACGVTSNGIIVTYAPRQQLPLYLSLCSLGLFFIRNSFSKIASSPTKHAELMGMGIPVVCNDIGDTGNIITETRAGIVIKGFSRESYQEAIEKISELTNISKDQIRVAALKIFDLHSGIDKYNEIYKRLTLN